MELYRKFEIATSCRSVSLGLLEPDQQYLIFYEKRINTGYGQSVLLAILDMPATSVKVFYRNGMAMCCPMKICMPSIRNV